MSSSQKKRVEEMLAQLESDVTDQITKGRRELQLTQGKVLNAIDSVIQNAGGDLAKKIHDYNEQLDKLEAQALSREINPEGCIKSAKEDLTHFEAEVMLELTTFIESMVGNTLIKKVNKLNTMIEDCAQKTDGSLHEVTHLKSMVNELKNGISDYTWDNLEYLIGRKNKHIKKNLSYLFSDTKNEAYKFHDTIDDYVDSLLETLMKHSNALVRMAKACIKKKRRKKKSVSRSSRLNVDLDDEGSDNA